MVTDDAVARVVRNNPRWSWPREGGRALLEGATHYAVRVAFLSGLVDDGARTDSSGYDCGVSGCQFCPQQELAEPAPAVPPSPVAAAAVPEQQTLDRWDLR